MLGGRPIRLHPVTRPRTPRGGVERRPKPVFTPYVRALVADRIPSPAQLEDLLAALRGALIGEMRRRGLWHAPPHHLGVVGRTRWRQPGAAIEAPLAGAIGELVADCYTSIFVQRLPRLAAQLKVKANIDGLVFLNIQHFLHDRQKRHDPMGYRVFKALHAAVRRSIARERLCVVAGPKCVRNATCLGFDAPPADLGRRNLEQTVRSWANELIPGIMNSGKRFKEVVRVLREKLEQLPSQGFSMVRFKDLIDPLKDEVRHRWTAVLQTTQGERGLERRSDGQRTPVAVVPPDRSVEDRDGFHKLRVGVRAGIARLRARAKTKHYLDRLWSFLCAYAAECPPSGDQREQSLIDQAALPSRRKLSALLDIPRERFPDLFETLRRLSAAQLTAADQAARYRSVQDTTGRR